MSPGHYRVVAIRSRNFSIANVCCFLGLYIELPGVVMWQHIDFVITAMYLTLVIFISRHP